MGATDTNEPNCKLQSSARGWWLIGVPLLLLPTCGTSTDSVQFPNIITAEEKAHKIALLQSPKSCFFIRKKYQCIGRFEKYNVGWESCCKTETCRGFCGTGSLPPNSRTLFLGNSHVRELSEAVVCQNLPLLVSVTYTSQSEVGGKNVTTYPYRDGMLTDEWNRTVVGDALELSTYIFSNNATVWVLANHPLMHAPKWLEAGFTYVGWLRAIGDALDFAWENLTGIIFNTGNNRLWGSRWWCKVIGELEPTVCKRLKHEVDKGIGESPLILGQEFLNALDKMNFHGGAVMTNHIDRQIKIPGADIFQKAHPYRLTYISSEDYTVSPGGLRGSIGEHPCLPGPPDDGANMALWHLYQS